MAATSPVVPETAARGEFARADARRDDARIPRRRAKTKRATRKLRIQAEPAGEKKSVLIAIGILPAG
jgi:hypothetical protein